MAPILYLHQKPIYCNIYALMIRKSVSFMPRSKCDEVIMSGCNDFINHTHSVSYSCGYLMRLLCLDVKSLYITSNHTHVGNHASPCEVIVPGCEDFINYIYSLMWVFDVAIVSGCKDFIYHTHTHLCG